MKSVDVEGRDAVTIAIQVGNKRIMKLLLKHGADLIRLNEALGRIEDGNDSDASSFEEIEKLEYKYFD